jgi:hypothetical protein
VSLPGILLVLKAQLLEAAEIALSHDTRRRRREESKQSKCLPVVILRLTFIDRGYLFKENASHLLGLLFLVSVVCFLAKFAN